MDVTFSEDAITDIVVKDHQETAGIADAVLPVRIRAGQRPNGKITVDVTFSEDAITDIVVKDHQETAGIADAAINDLPGEIVASRAAVDAKSGATFTSEGIVNAVADAVAQAGGDADALRAVPVEKELSTETIEMTTDVVVVGGGAAGMAATVRLEQLGKNVILLEKASFLGGTISVSGGSQVVMGSKLQAEAGVTDDSVDSMVEDFMKNGANLNVPELLNLYAENIGETTDWLNEDCGIAFDMEARPASTGRIQPQPCAVLRGRRRRLCRQHARSGGEERCDRAAVHPCAEPERGRRQGDRRDRAGERRHHLCHHG